MAYITITTYTGISTSDVIICKPSNVDCVNLGTIAQGEAPKTFPIPALPNYDNVLQVYVTLSGSSGCQVTEVGSCII
jgi:hypothetical protein